MSLALTPEEIEAVLALSAAAVRRRTIRRASVPAHMSEATTGLPGRSWPRVAPPMPATSLLSIFEDAATDLRIGLMPWQRIAAAYMTGRTGEQWAYREIVIVTARQNGKTTLILPRILMGLKRGESILHTAQNRDLPRKTFITIAGLVSGLPEIASVRMANGQEEITGTNGSRYKLVAPNSHVRGETADLVLLDEVREQHDQQVMDAILPTITARKDAQIIYLSNAGDQDSIVLNDLRRRAGSDERLAYLEWSAGPERVLDDRDGWREANPAIGYGDLTMETLEYFRANRPPESFETEHLCRWVTTMRPRLVTSELWEQGRDALTEPLRPVMGINMDPDGKRASAYIAWPQSGSVETVACRVVAEVTGDPIDTDRLGKDLSQLALRAGVTMVGFGAWTDAGLAKHFRKAKAIDGRDFANASMNFVRLIEAHLLRWDVAEQIGEDLAWTARKPHESGAWQAVKAVDDHPATAVLAAIRAVWLASGPRLAAPRVM